MPWLQLHIPSTAENADALEDALLACGAHAVSLTDGADQPLFEPPPGATPLWRETVVSALFEADQSQPEILQALQQQLDSPPADYRFEMLEDQPWERAWMADFQPMQFGQRLWIVPSWCEPPEPDAVNLRLDPGLAFGTGTHETTALCLEWLDGEPVSGRRLLDFGCGSGVLAIATLLLGAEHAEGCDIDPQALDASRANALLNGVSERFECRLAEQVSPQQQYDLVVANILAGPLVALASVLAGHCRPGGRLALSGILAEQADSIIEAYRQQFRLDPVAQRGDWVRISGTRLQD